MLVCPSNDLFTFELDNGKDLMSSVLVYSCGGYPCLLSRSDCAYTFLLNSLLQVGFFFFFPPIALPVGTQPLGLVLFPTLIYHEAYVSLQGW